MIDKLRDFINKYSQVMTIDMLFDLANSVGIEPSKLIVENKISTNKSKPKVPLYEKKEKEAIVTQNIVCKHNLVCNDSVRRFDENKYFTCEEVADLFKVEKTTVWAWIRTKQLNAIKFGYYYRVHSRDITEFESSRMTGNSDVR